MVDEAIVSYVADQCVAAVLDAEIIVSECGGLR